MCELRSIINNRDEANYMYGGGDYVMTAEELEALTHGKLLNWSVNEEYGFTISLAKEARAFGEWMVVDDVYCQCPFCNKVEVIFADYCRKCGARLHEPEVE